MMDKPTLQENFTFIHSVLLGLIQGITEFLPISSSGHLSFARLVLKIKFENPLVFDTAVHLGTLMAVFILMWKKAIETLLTPKKALAILTGFFATVPVALAFEDFAIKVGKTPHLLSSSFLAGGFLLLLSYFGNTPQKAKKDIWEMWLLWIVVGVFQGIAVIPGISRAGTTISVAIFLGAKKEDAFDFSMLLSIPTIVSATLWEARHIFLPFLTAPTPNLSPHIIPLHLVATSFLVSFISGLLALLILKKIVIKGKLYLFAFWMFFIGLLIFILL